MIQKNLISLS